MLTRALDEAKTEMISLVSLSKQVPAQVMEPSDAAATFAETEADLRKQLADALVRASTAEDLVLAQTSSEDGFTKAELLEALEAAAQEADAEGLRARSLEAALSEVHEELTEADQSVRSASVVAAEKEAAFRNLEAEAATARLDLFALQKEFEAQQTDFALASTTVEKMEDALVAREYMLMDKDSQLQATLARYHVVKEDLAKAIKVFSVFAGEDPALRALLPSASAE